LSSEVFVIVLLVAVGHAAWNALLRIEPDKHGMMRVMFATQIAAALAVLPFVTLPDPAALPYLITSAAIGTGAMFLLSHAYKLGDLSQVYPLSRGSAPLIVVLVSTVLLGESITPQALAGIALIALGVISLSFAGNIRSLPNMPLIAVALANGALSALCNLLDGYGARVSGSTIGYVATLGLTLSLMVVFTTQFTSRGKSAAIAARTIWLGALAGLMSLIAAGTAIWAMTRAPIPLVSALRETSIIFAAAIGIFIFREKLTIRRLVSIALVLLGVIALRLDG